MKVRLFPIFGLALMPLLALVYPACDDEDDCPAGYEGCQCTADYTCLDGLECLSEFCVASLASGGSGGNASETSGDGGSSSNNVAACEAFLDDLACALPDGALDCSLYAEVDCDVTDYLDCLTDNSSCVGDVVDLSGWGNCASFVEDCA